MIDLSRTRADLLTEIDAPEPRADSLIDITDPRVATMDAHVRVCGHAQEHLFSLAKNALLERFATVPRSRLIAELLIPLKTALGNAYRHGNLADAAKSIVVELVLTSKGVLIAVTDEGEGFDAALTFRRFEDQETYFVNRGAGLRNLHMVGSTVSYENGGRTLLLCYRPARQPAIQDVGSADQIGAPEGPGSCRVYAPGGIAGDDCGNRYVMRTARHDGQAAETLILTGRQHVTEAAARADFEAASNLYKAKTTGWLHIPRPLARLGREPGLVLYDFDPWLNLWEFFTHRGRLEYLQQYARWVGRALAQLHGNQDVLRGASTALGGEEGLEPMVARAERTLQALPCEPGLLHRFRLSAQRMLSRGGFGRQPVLAPIHGGLGWDCIHYGVDSRFYLYRFETCRRSDPGLDLGGFASDLLSFTLAHHDAAAYRTCHDAFLSNYNSNAPHPIGEDDVRFYTALALSERLKRLKPGAWASAGRLLEALEAALSGSGTDAERRCCHEVSDRER